MGTIAKWTGVAATVAMGWLGVTADVVQAQQPYPVRPGVPSYYPPIYPPTGYYPRYPYTGGYNPGYVPPTTGSDGSSGSSSSGGYGPGYMPGYNPYSYYMDPYGGYLRGAADVMRSYGQLAMDNEQARILREVVNQAKIDTKKKLIDLLNYERQHLPTFADDQKRIEKLTLERIKTTATLSEIWSGKSSNILLKDLGKHRALKLSVEDISLQEDVLRRINVATAYGNLGVLKNDGQVTWASALLDPGTQERRSNIETDALKLYRQAMDAQPNGSLVRDLQSNIGALREQLLKKVNDIPTPQYIEAKRFLSDLDDAVVALRDGDAIRYVEFHKYVTGGKTVRELVNFMLDKGLIFAPANASDEGAYQALHSALVAHNIAVNAQLAYASKE